MNYDKLKRILQMEELKVQKYCYSELRKAGYTEIYNDETFLYAKGEIPILLVAHMDTVHKTLPYELYYDNNSKVMWSPEGIGGDDRCGVFTILEIIKKYKPCVLFTQMEESGGWGATDFVQSMTLGLLDCDVNFLLEIDRKGNNEVVFYDCGNEEFQEYILSYGFELEYGTFTDICVLSDYMGVASANVSAGYIREHTKTETIHLNWMEETFFKVKAILETPSNKRYDYQHAYNYDKFISKFPWTYAEDSHQFKLLNDITDDEDNEEQNRRLLPWGK